MTIQKSWAAFTLPRTPKEGRPPTVRSSAKPTTISPRRITTTQKDCYWQPSIADEESKHFAWHSVPNSTASVHAAYLSRAVPTVTDASTGNHLETLQETVCGQERPNDVRVDCSHLHCPNSGSVRGQRIRSGASPRGQRIRRRRRLGRDTSTYKGAGTPRDGPREPRRPLAEGTRLGKPRTRRGAWLPKKKEKKN